MFQNPVKGALSTNYTQLSLYDLHIISKNNRNTHEYKYVYFSICLAFSFSIPDCDQAAKVDRLNNDYK